MAALNIVYVGISSGNPSPYTNVIYDTVLSNYNWQITNNGGLTLNLTDSNQETAYIEVDDSDILIGYKMIDKKVPTGEFKMIKKKVDDVKSQDTNNINGAKEIWFLNECL